ncbi:21758_t:CDS:1, partial [Gigaspora rosea]
EETCSEYDKEQIQLYCTVCGYETFKEDDCIHLPQRIDFVEVFEFAQFLKNRCDNDHYIYSVTKMYLE